VDECCLTCGQAADVFSWLAPSGCCADSVRTVPARRDRLGRALNTGS